jgi:hypothetical protein
VPVDDAFFQQLNDAQAIWYQIQFALDDKDQFELLRDVAEHNAMFTNPEGVQQVREARENTYETSEEDFDDYLKETFGRRMPKVSDNEKVPFDAKSIITQEEQRKMNQYLDLELDEITFTPYE